MSIEFAANNKRAVNDRSFVVCIFYEFPNLEACYYSCRYAENCKRIRNSDNSVAVDISDTYIKLGGVNYLCGNTKCHNSGRELHR